MERDPQKKAHLLGLGLDCDDGHKRITTAKNFSILGGSEKTHDRMTETVCKTFEDIGQKNKTIENMEPQEIADILQKNTPA
jgi:hypothetical protein